MSEKFCPFKPYPCLEEKCLAWNDKYSLCKLIDKNKIPLERKPIPTPKPITK